MLYLPQFLLLEHVIEERRSELFPSGRIRGERHQEHSTQNLQAPPQKQRRKVASVQPHHGQIDDMHCDGKIPSQFGSPNYDRDKKHTEKRIEEPHGKKREPHGVIGLYELPRKDPIDGELVAIQQSHQIEDGKCGQIIEALESKNLEGDVKGRVGRCVAAEGPISREPHHNVKSREW